MYIHVQRTYVRRTTIMSTDSGLYTSPHLPSPTILFGTLISMVIICVSPSCAPTLQHTREKGGIKRVKVVQYQTPDLYSICTRQGVGGSTPICLCHFTGIHVLRLHTQGKKSTDTLSILVHTV